MSEISSIRPGARDVAVRGVPSGPRERAAYLDRLWRHLPRVCRRTEFSYDSYNGPTRSEVVCDVARANVMTSQLLHSPKLHAPMLDLDIPATLLNSSTPGHHHLIIDHAMTWRQYKRLLRAMGRAGLLEKGFVNMSIRRGYSSARLPWVSK